MLSFIERIAAGFWNGCQRIVSLISPFRRGRDFFRMGPGLRWTLHILILSAILIGLGWLNWIFKLDKLIIAPTVLGVSLRNYWLPILFLLLYIMTWLGWWLWKLLGPEEYTSEFPDIDEAWEAALEALHEAQIELSDAPLFLVLGRAAGGDEALIHAAQLSLTVKQTPRKAEAPLHVYANRDGIYVTCAGASLLGKQAAVLAGADEDSSPPGVDGSGGDPADSSGDDAFKTLRPKGRLKDVQAILARAREEGRSPEQLTEAEKGEIRVLVSDEEAEQVQEKRKTQPSLLKNPAEVERLSARIRHLCRLISRDRRPFCPLNGILLLVPLACTDRDEDATNTGSICQQELAAIRSVLQVNCPLLALVCDLERAPGFREFIDRFPADQRQRRLGQRYPLVPDLETSDLPGMVDGGVAWIFQSMLPNWIYKLFRLESGRDDLTSIVRGNVRLYRLLGEMRERQKRLSKVLGRGLIHEHGPSLFGGCYIAGTGKDAAHEQAFVAGVFRRLIENQNYISWTHEALAEEADNNRWSTYGYTGLGIAAAALLTLGFFFWTKK